MISKLLKTTKAVVIGLAGLATAALLGLSLPNSSWEAYSVQTGSMQPSIDPGALVVVRRVDADQLQPGQVITYVDPANRQQTITHRLIAFETSTMGTPRLVTRGDANQSPDAPIPADKLVGRVSMSLPLIGGLTNFMKQPAGLVLFIYLPALLVAGHEIRRLAAHYRQNQDYHLFSYRSFHRPSSKGMAVAAVMIIGAPAALVVPVQATLKDTVTMSNISLSSVDQNEPPQEPPQEPQPPTTDTTITQNCTITNNNETTINNNNQQNVRSGNSSASNNRLTGNVSSGDASASNSTTNNINIDNQSDCPDSPDSTTSTDDQQ